MRIQAFPIVGARPFLTTFGFALLAIAATIERLAATGGESEVSAGFVFVYDRDLAALIALQALAAGTVAVLAIRAAILGRASARAIRGALSAAAVYAVIWLVPGLMALSPGV